VLLGNGVQAAILGLKIVDPNGDEAASWYDSKYYALIVELVSILRAALKGNSILMLYMLASSLARRLPAPIAAIDPHSEEEA
jgi:hypothetical protein